jgi:hypothetical protein
MVIFHSITFVEEEEEEEEEEEVVIILGLDRPKPSHCLERPKPSLGFHSV